MNEVIQGGLKRLDVGDPENQLRLEQVFRYAQVGRCVNGVTHDINNHLGAAMAYAELALMDEGIGEETQQTIEKVITAIDKCGKLVNLLTGVARPMSNNTNMIDLNVLVRGVLLLRDYAFRVAKIEFTTELSEGLPSAIADGPKVQLALLYILFNIEEYFVAAQTKGSVVVRSYRDENGLFVEIKNSGDAIPADMVTAMFESYTTSKDGNNMGMGLALARNMMQTQNGDVTYDAAHGFLMRLPVPGT
jgi:two-component system C4-dicarboxylate transport sensor histidine kinase DctB